MNRVSDVGNMDTSQAQLLIDLAAARRQISELEATTAERELILEALRDSESLYRSIVQSVDIGLTLIGRDHRVILANEAQGQLFHKPAAEFVGTYCFAEFEKRDAVCPHCPGIQAMATGQPAMVETTGIRDDGTTNFAQIRAFPVLNADRVSVGFIEIVEDISVRKLAEKRRQESEERFRLLIEHAADAVFVHDADTRIIDVNRRACESLGYTREELLNLSVQDFDAAFNAQARDNWKRLVPGKPETVERVHRRRDSSTFPVEVRLGVIESGGRRLFLALVRDITERKHAEQMLARRAMLLQTGAEVSHVASSIIDPEELMCQVVELIRTHLDLYYVGLFLLDRALRLHSQPGEWAELRAATGEAGRAMLTQGHRLRVGGNSMVGQCIARGEPRIALDTNREATRFSNPLLPDTRSELALPLISRGQAIGALTIQSVQADAFTPEDIAALDIMAGQIANSIENTRLYKETQAALEELRGIHGRYVRQGWNRYLGRSDNDK